MRMESTRWVRAFLTTLLLTMPANGWAVPAAPAIIQLQQSDGSTFDARQWGDEHQHGWETLTGYAILFNTTTQSWTYALRTEEGSLTSSSSRVGIDAVPNNLPQHLRPDATPLYNPQSDIISTKTILTSPISRAAPPTSGIVYIPTFLIHFSDTTPTFAAQDFQTIFFDPGNNSLRDYFEEVSYGAFSISPGPGGISGWYTAAHPHDYYGTNKLINNTFTKDQYPGTLVREAVTAADAAGFNFAPYDQDGDCYVDVVSIVFQGTDEANSGIETDLWPHCWSLSAAYYYGSSDAPQFVTNDACIADPSQQVKIDTYLTTAEIATDGGLNTIGGIAHEYGHILGLPDLYDYDGSSYGVGNWSLMAGGAYNYTMRLGDSPAHPDAWSKYFVGWVAPTLVTQLLVDEPIDQAATTPDVYQLLQGAPTPFPNGEYFLVENRQRIGFDQALPGEGLLIWHIDEAKAAANNSDNTSECYPDGPSCAQGHYRVSLVQADGFWHMEKHMNKGDAGDPYPGLFNIGRFSDTSEPSSNLFDGTASGASVEVTSVSGTTMTATFTVAQNATDPYQVDADGDGYTPAQGDCDDEDNTIHPGAQEICADGIDQDCDGSDDLACPTASLTIKDGLTIHVTLSTGVVALQSDDGVLSENIEFLHPPLYIAISQLAIGAMVNVTLTWSMPAPEQALVYTWLDEAWINWDDNCQYNESRTAITFQLTDGGDADNDQTADGRITLPIGLATDSSSKDATSGGSGGGGVCFISDLLDRSILQ